MCEYRRDLLPESESNLEGNHTGSLRKQKIRKTYYKKKGNTLYAENSA